MSIKGEVPPELKITVGEYPSVTVLTHDDDSVSMGFSGRIYSKIFQFDVAKLQAELNKRSGTTYGTTTYRVADTAVTGDIPRAQCVPSQCSEPKAAAAPHGSGSSTIGMDTIWQGTTKNNLSIYWTGWNFWTTFLL